MHTLLQPHMQNKDNPHHHWGSSHVIAWYLLFALIVALSSGTASALPTVSELEGAWITDQGWGFVVDAEGKVSNLTLFVQAWPDEEDSQGADWYPTFETIQIDPNKNTLSADSNFADQNGTYHAHVSGVFTSTESFTLTYECTYQSYVSTGMASGSGSMKATHTYSSTLPNLTFSQPSYSNYYSPDKVSVSNSTGYNSTDTWQDTDTLYVDYAIVNGNYNVDTIASVDLSIDGVQEHTSQCDVVTPYFNCEWKDINIGKLDAGVHILQLVIDSNNDVFETDETDNVYEKTIYVVEKEIEPVVSTKTTTAVEFYRPDIDHYVHIVGAGEIASVAANTQWQKTGYTFEVYPLDAAPADTIAIARYYGALQEHDKYTYQPDSHFYTGSPSERRGLDARYRDVCPYGQGSCWGEAWHYEGNVYRAYLPDGSSCPNGTRRLYRFYNNGYPTKDSNHRYTVDTGVADYMRSIGWIDEGVKLCVPQ